MNATIHRRKAILVSAAFLNLGFAMNATGRSLPEADRPDLVAAFMDRIGEPSPQALKTFADAGMDRIAAHPLSPAHRAALQAVLHRTPEPLLRAAVSGVDRLSFVDGLAGHGFGLTRTVSADGEPPRFEITLRADVFTEELGAMLTRKERLSLQSESAASLVVMTEYQTALRYVLTHELAHVWERLLPAGKVDEIREGVWRDWRTLAAGLGESPVATHAYRRRPPQSAAAMASVYESLVQSPFVSLYATASAHEYFAECAAWAVLMRDGGLQIQLTLPGGGVQTFRPLSNGAARKRLDLVAAMLGLGPLPSS